ncbi:hypothetical protein [Intrasporangium calvum]|uniref:hypothetical protein n=1 Tax=Intrasporangium calvum TaxID=53358 RepID=UPI000DF5D526|nr:hypothetical protein [Intrasporangium calvum]AXG12058.1 hypothetical protein DN585_00135 [Intrasporangium calvum]AXG15154.1 hypothetical protein DN585_18575 [Intrasporangium calvum]
MSDEPGWAAPGPAPSGGTDRWVPPDAGSVPPDAGSVPPDAGSAPPPPPPSGGYRPAPPPPPAPRLEYRPGIIPLRPLTLGEIWSGVFATVRGNPGATLGLALLTTALALVPATALAIWLAGQDLGLAAVLSADPFGDPNLSAGAYSDATLASYVPGLAMWVVSLLLPLFVALVIGHAIQGRKVTLGQTWQQTRGRILPAIGTTLLIVAMFAGVIVVVLLAAAGTWASGDGAGSVALTVLLVVGFAAAAVYLWVKVSFAVTIVVLESAGPRRAVRRSWGLTGGRPFWRIFGIRLLTAIVASIVGSIVATPIGLIALFAADDPDATSMAWVLPLTQAVSLLVQGVLVTPFVSGVDSLLYVDQRIRREGLDVQLMQQFPTSPSG